MDSKWKPISKTVRANYPGYSTNIGTTSPTSRLKCLAKGATNNVSPFSAKGRFRMTSAAKGSMKGAAAWTNGAMTLVDGVLGYSNPQGVSQGLDDKIRKQGYISLEDRKVAAVSNMFQMSRSCWCLTATALFLTNKMV